MDLIAVRNHPLRKARFRKQITQVTLGKMFNIKPECIGRMELGKRRMTRELEMWAFQILSEDGLQSTLGEEIKDWRPPPPPRTQFEKLKERREQTFASLVYLMDLVEAENLEEAKKYSRFMRIVMENQKRKKFSKKRINYNGH